MDFRIAMASSALADDADATESAAVTIATTITPHRVPRNRDRENRLEAAGAIAAVTRYYQSYELPKGAIQGSPPIPDDDMKTLQVPLYLVASKKTSNDVISALAKAIFDARRDLLGQFPPIAQISEPDTDKSDTENDAYIPIHPGAAAYYSGNVQTFFDKHGDQIFYGSMLLGTLTSLLAAGWKFITQESDRPEDRPLMRLYALQSEIATANNEGSLVLIEQRVDDILKGELEKCAAGKTEAAETAALSLATHRLEHLISRRRLMFSGTP
jgi:hypothetical protein